jgi:recombination protein RecA
MQRTKYPKKNKNIEQQIDDRFNIITTKKEIELLSSGCNLLDCALGGGYPLGGIVNLVGDNSTGKTLLALELIFSCIKQYDNNFVWRYNDAESGLYFDTKNIYNFVFSDNNLCHSQTVEEFNADIRKFLKKIKPNQKALYVVDSLDGMDISTEIERVNKNLDNPDKKAKESYGMGMQKYLSQFFRHISDELKNKNCLLLILSQVRYNIGVMFGRKFTRSGGKALDHYASQIIWLAQTDKNIKGKRNRVVGITIKAKLDKNKIGRPFRECFINILFDMGVDNISTNVDFLYDLKTDTGKEKKVSTLNPISWETEKFAFTEKEKFIKYIEDNKQEKELNNKVKELWYDIEKEIAPINRKRKF